MATFKTLKTDKESMKTMAELGGILNHYLTEFVNQNIRDFTPSAELKHDEIRRAKNEYSVWLAENALLSAKKPQFGIYQVKGSEARDYRFSSLDELEARSLSVNKANYNLVYNAPIPKLTALASEAQQSEQPEFHADADNHYPTLNKIYELFNFDGRGNRPPDYRGWSVSVSDVIVLQHGGEVASYYVDSFGFKELPKFTGAERNLPHREDNDFLQGSGNRLAIYQISKDLDKDKALDYLLSPLDELAANGLDVERKNYKFIYQTPFSERIEFLRDRNTLLNEIYQKFNYNRPEDFTGLPLSISDVVVLKYNGDFAAFYVDKTGFVEIDGFLSQEKAVLPQLKEQFAAPGNPAAEAPAETAAKDADKTPASFSWEDINKAVDTKMEDWAKDPAKAADAAKETPQITPEER
jgi:hypothetical protein